MSICLPVYVRLSLFISRRLQRCLYILEEDSVCIYRVVSLEVVRRAIHEAAVTRSPRPLVIVIVIVVIAVVHYGTSACIHHISLFIYYILYIGEHQWRQYHRPEGSHGATGREGMPLYDLENNPLNKCPMGQHSAFHK